jgi:drug/metabolite transporter (DMT)-like permease
MRIVIVGTTIAMVAFAANSLLARLALADGAIDAASYTALRLVSGAVALGGFLVLARGRALLDGVPGDWPSAAALFAYAAAFSYAYLELGAAMGALILFASVQATMIGWSIAQGDRPNLAQWGGFTIAFGAFVYLLLPGIGMPEPVGAALMIVSGIAWGIYSVRGRNAANPLAETSGNFVRSALFCMPLMVFAMPGAHADPQGAGLAVASGVVASGLGYAVWYRVLPQLGSTLAAIVQLTVPIIAAVGAIVLLSEPMTLRLAIAGSLVLGGVGWAVLARPKKPAAG